MGLVAHSRRVSFCACGIAAFQNSHFGSTASRKATPWLSEKLTHSLRSLRDRLSFRGSSLTPIDKKTTLMGGFLFGCGGGTCCPLASRVVFIGKLSLPRKPPAWAPPLLGKPHRGFPAALTHSLRSLRDRLSFRGSSLTPIEKKTTLMGGFLFGCGGGT